MEVPHPLPSQNSKLRRSTSGMIHVVILIGISCVCVTCICFLRIQCFRCEDLFKRVQTNEYYPGELNLGNVVISYIHAIVTTMVATMTVQGTSSTSLIESNQPQNAATTQCSCREDTDTPRQSLPNEREDPN